MSDEQERPRDAGDAIREGVRSITGMLGALKEAIEDTFDELRGVDTSAADRGEAPSSAAFRKAQETVDEVRERFDFVTRREFEALRKEVEELRARLGEPSGSADAGSSTHTATPPSEPEPPPDRADSSGTRYRFEVE
jgi:hypothetical protein